MNWAEISASVFISFVLNGLGLLIVKSMIDIARDRDMKNTELLHAKNLLEFTTGLKKIEMIQSTRFADLHKRRAEVIAELYKLLAQAERRLRMRRLPTPIISQRELTKEEVKEIREKDFDEWTEKIYIATVAVSDFYEDNKVFLSSDQTELMDRIVQIFKSLSLAMTARMPSPDEWVSENKEDNAMMKNILEKRTNRLQEARDQFTTIYPSIKANLESSFRNILGFRVEQSTDIA